MKSSLKSGWLCLLLVQLAQGAQEKTEDKPLEIIYQPKGLLLILHADAEKDDFMDSSLPRFIKAYEDECPFIVSAAVVEAAQHIKAAGAGFGVWTKPTSQQEEYLNELRGKLRVFNTYRQPDWCVKKINKELFLYVPLYLYRQRLLNEKKLSRKHVDVLVKARKDAIDAYTPGEGITWIEQELGLKVNHMETVNDPYAVKKGYAFRNMGEEFIAAVWDKRKQKSSIFVTNREYVDAHEDISKPLFIPEWVFYMAGHGNIPQSICGARVADMPIEEFKEWLDFLQSKITTKLLYYSSCYAGGLNEKELYKNDESVVQKTYPFTLIAQSLTDIPVYVHRANSELNALRFDDFFKIALSDDSIDFKKLAECVVIPDKNYPLSRVPRVKIKNIPWFSVVDRKATISIGRVFAKTRKESLKITADGVKEPRRGVLLYVLEIPFEIVLDYRKKAVPTAGVNLFNSTARSFFYNELPLFVSMIPGSATHHFFKVSSTTLSPLLLIVPLVRILNYDYIDPFYAHRAERIQKIVRIDCVEGVALSSLGSVFPFIQEKQGDKIVFSDVCIDLTFESEGIYFTYRGVCYKGRFKGGAFEKFEKASDEDEKEYRRLLKMSGPNFTISKGALRAQHAKLEDVQSTGSSHKTVSQQLRFDKHLKQAGDMTSSDVKVLDATSVYDQVTADNIARLEGVLEKKIKALSQEIEEDVD